MVRGVLGTPDPLIGLDDESTRCGFVADEAQPRPRATIGKEATTPADDDGSDHEPHLIDQPRCKQGLGEPGAAVNLKFTPRLLFELCDLGRDVAG